MTDSALVIAGLLRPPGRGQLTVSPPGRDGPDPGGGEPWVCSPELVEPRAVLSRSGAPVLRHEEVAVQAHERVVVQAQGRVVVQAQGEAVQAQGEAM